MGVTVEPARRVRRSAARAAPRETYTWPPGFYPAVAASTFKRAFDTLARDLGRTPEAADIVAAARDAGHVLHPCFVWDVAAAAQAHWLDQANRLVRSLRVSFTQGPNINVPMRALFRVDVDGERTWAGHGVVLSQPDLQAQVIRDIRTDLSHFIAKYRVFLVAIGAMAQAEALASAVAGVLEA
jgi:hypothetical protein